MIHKPLIFMQTNCYLVSSMGLATLEVLVWVKKQMRIKFTLQISLSDTFLVLIFSLGCFSHRVDRVSNKMVRKRQINIHFPIYTEHMYFFSTAIGWQCVWCYMWNDQKTLLWKDIYLCRKFWLLGCHFLLQVSNAGVFYLY